MNFQKIIISASLYKQNVAVLLPLILITIAVFFIKKVPYINLYQDYIILMVLAIDWLTIFWITKVKTSNMIKIGLSLYLLTLPLYYFKLYLLIGAISNLTYLIIGTSIIFEIIKYVQNKPGCKIKH